MYRMLVVSICATACGPPERVGTMIVDDGGKVTSAAIVEAELAAEVGEDVRIVPGIGARTPTQGTSFDHDEALRRQNEVLPPDVRVAVERALRLDRGSDWAQGCMICGDDVPLDIPGASYVEAEDGDGRPMRCAAWAPGTGPTYLVVERLAGRRP